MAGRAVEQHEQPGEQEQQHDKQGDQLIEQAPPPVPPEPRSRRSGGAGVESSFDHQKAWPSDTVTANGPSPFCRLSGTPMSTRMGPKLE